MHKSGLKLVGKFVGILKDKDGRVKKRVEKENLIVNGGLDGIADQLLNNPTIPVPSHMGLGEGTTPPTVGDTALENERGTRQTLTKERELNEVKFYAVFGPNEPVNDTMTITEAGIFNAASGGTMWARVTFGVVTKEPADTFDVTWTWQIKNA